MRGEYLYHKFPARRLVRSQHHHRRIALNPKKRKVRTGLGDMPTEELCSKLGLWGTLMMTERESVFYDLVGRRRS